MPRNCTAFSPVKSRDFTVKVCNPKYDRDAKAELNRRSQACEVLAGTGIRVARVACRAEATAKAGDRKSVV